MWSQRVVEAFFRDLPVYSALPPEKILFVLDGIRYPYLNDAHRSANENSYFGQMRRYFKQAAAMRGYRTIDMQPVFMDHFAEHGVLFEHPPDAHWNSLGHRLVAEEIEKSAIFRSIIGGSSAADK